ncbi:MAG: hypothetical protein J6A28_01570 [Clostridia bacterium]|nr:hypothetical protein [Clostridia bacterium]
MKYKKVRLLILPILVALALCGCENSTDITAAFISESTSAGSENYGVKITYSDDSRLEEKYTDVQIKFSKKGEIVIWKENQEKFTYKIDDYDEWYSMTVIFAAVEGKEGKEEFEPIKSVLAKSYFFNSEIAQEITFRVVAGDIEENSTGSGYILVGAEPISNQFTLKIAKK